MVPGEGGCGTIKCSLDQMQSGPNHAASLHKQMHTHTDLLIVHVGGAPKLYDCLRLLNEKELKHYGNAFVVVKLEMELHWEE